MTRSSRGDVIALDLDDPGAYASPDYHLESVMHVEVYRARDDVNSVIHGHPLYGTALGATDATLQLLTHDAVLFTDGLGIYDEGPALVTEASQGRQVAAALGYRRACLLRNHGVVIAAEDVRWAVLTAVTLERAVRFQSICAIPGCRTAHPGRFGRGPSSPEISGPLPGRVLGGMGAPRGTHPGSAAAGRLTCASHRCSTGT